MCTFCEKIYPEKDCQDIVFGRGKYSSMEMEDEIDSFITIDKDGQFDLNVNPGDPYELGFIPNVKFCPYCGRNLAKNEDQEFMEANINGYTEGLKDSSKSETVTEFADRCRECGAKYGKLLKHFKEMEKLIKNLQENQDILPMGKFKTTHHCCNPEEE